MADDLLEKLSERHLPAIPGESQEPSEPSQLFEDRQTRGRAPADVVRERQYRETTDDVDIPAARGRKTQAPEKITIEGREYSRAELAQTIQTARQWQNYAQALQAQQAQQQAAPAEAPAVSNAQIAQVYDPVAQIIINDLITNGSLIEEDLYEAYPRSMKTLVGQLRFAFDEIFQQKEMLHRAIARLEATITYLNANKAQTEGQIIANKYNANLDALIKKDAQLYAGLKDEHVRAAFTAFLVQELNATVEQTVGKHGLAFIARQWVGFNSPEIVGRLKGEISARRQQQNKRFVVGEGSGSRPGTFDSEPDLLTRMIQNSGRIRETGTMMILRGGMEVGARISWRKLVQKVVAWWKRKPGGDPKSLSRILGEKASEITDLKPTSGLPEAEPAAYASPAAMPLWAMTESDAQRAAGEARLKSLGPVSGFLPIPLILKPEEEKTREHKITDALNGTKAP